MAPAAMVVASGGIDGCRNLDPGAVPARCLERRPGLVELPDLLALFPYFADFRLAGLADAGRAGATFAGSCAEIPPRCTGNSRDLAGCKFRHHQRGPAIR